MQSYSTRSEKRAGVAPVVQPFIPAHSGPSGRPHPHTHTPTHQSGQQRLQTRMCMEAGTRVRQLGFPFIPPPFHPGRRPIHSSLHPSSLSSRPQADPHLLGSDNGEVRVSSAEWVPGIGGRGGSWTRRGRPREAVWHSGGECRELSVRGCFPGLDPGSRFAVCVADAGLCWIAGNPVIP
jgi:hypothetical protein